MCQSVQLCPQIRSVSLPLLSITFHCGSSASRGIISSDIWLLLPPLSRKQGQVGSLRIETLGLMQFPSCPLLCNVTGAKVGYWQATLMGSLATVLGHSGFSFLLLGHLPNQTPFIVHSSKTSYSHLWFRCNVASLPGISRVSETPKWANPCDWVHMLSLILFSIIVRHVLKLLRGKIPISTICWITSWPK